MLAWQIGIAAAGFGFVVLVGAALAPTIGPGFGPMPFPGMPAPAGGPGLDPTLQVMAVGVLGAVGPIIAIPVGALIGAAVFRRAGAASEGTACWSCGYRRAVDSSAGACSECGAPATIEQIHRFWRIQNASRAGDRWAMARRRRIERMRVRAGAPIIYMGWLIAGAISVSGFVGGSFEVMLTEGAAPWRDPVRKVITLSPAHLVMVALAFGASAVAAMLTERDSRFAIRRDALRLGAPSAGERMAAFERNPSGS